MGGGEYVPPPSYPVGDEHTLQLSQPRREAEIGVAQGDAESRAESREQTARVQTAAVHPTSPSSASSRLVRAGYISCALYFRILSAVCCSTPPHARSPRPLPVSMRPLHAGPYTYDHGTLSSYIPTMATLVLHPSLLRRALLLLIVLTLSPSSLAILSDHHLSFVVVSTSSNGL